jgi:glucosamine kinase
MKLIADSGSTKTEWRTVDDKGNISQFRSEGINPYYQSLEDIQSVIKEGLNDFIDQNITSIYFYGAGCSSTKNIEKVRSSIETFFPSTEININHDLLAAAHALCGHEAGIACVLGTGSNSCFYNGKSIVKNVSSLGFILGDEGSGNYLGKKLLTAFGREDLPESVRNKLIKRFDLSIDNIQEKVYLDDFPVRYLASFSKFIFQNIKEPYLYKLVYESISTFFESCIMKYDNYDKLPVHFTGSVAFYYGNIVRKIAADKGILVKHITESPIAGLALYHNEK